MRTHIIIGRRPMPIFTRTITVIILTTVVFTVLIVILIATIRIIVVVMIKSQISTTKTIRIIHLK